MSPCMVLRCPNPATSLRNLHGDDESYLRVDLVVCAYHNEQMDSGTPWEYDSDQHAILMGEDMTAVMLPGGTWTQTMGGLVWTINYGHNEDDAKTIRIRLTEKDLDSMRTGLDFFHPKRADED